MSINKSLGLVLDRAVASHERLADFARLKVNGAELRNYFRETSGLQCQIVFYRDKYWDSQGGTLYGELFCLVPEVQLALSGQSQSLSTPDYAVPFHHFQYGTSTADAVRSWSFRTEQDVVDFATDAQNWLVEVALPWFRQFESWQGVLAVMTQQRRHVDLALLHAARGERDVAVTELRRWLALLPRQNDTPLAKLREAGLLSAADHAALARASLQRDDHYREQLDAWLSAAKPAV